VSSYFDTLNRHLRDSSAVAVHEPAAPIVPLPIRSLRPRALPSAYTTLRERLLSLDNGTVLKAIVFAGCRGGEGCTRLVGEFAEMLAASGLSVLLVDADARAADHAAASGGSTDLAEAISLGGAPATVDVGRGRLATVRSPASVPDKERLFRAPEFASWLQDQRGNFDYVLLDAPPLLQCADGTVMGRLSDGVVIVARAEVTSTDALVRTREQLERAEVNVLGVVLNRTRDPVPPALKRYLTMLIE
jgi:Mrp family chromosome partitioning ATPase